MIELRDASPASLPRPASEAPALVERVRDAAASLGCTRVWARAAGPNVLLGLGGDNAFARLIPLCGTVFGLSFRRPSTGSPGSKWEPLFVVDELPHVVEHALVAVDAL